MFRKIFLLVFVCGLFGCGNRESSSEESYSEENVAALVASNYSADDLYEELLAREQLEIRDTSMFLPDTIILLNQKLIFYSDLELEAALREKYASFAIYGDDNRHNIHDAIVSQLQRETALKVACIVPKDELDSLPDGSFELSPIGLYKDKFRLCPEESFREEPYVTGSSGFAVGNRVFLTAGHCIDTANYANHRIVYGYRMMEDRQPVLVIRKEDVYRIKKIIAYQENNGGPDFCVLETMEDFPASSILKLRGQGKIADSQKVYVAGYPEGLPLKLSLNAYVQENGEVITFKINSDTFKGNSGSPVINDENGLVEGILIAGHPKSYEYIRRCYEPKQCAMNLSNCTGERIMRISAILPHIPK